MTTTRFGVGEISCGHCKSSIEGAVAPVAGVHTARVDIEGKTVTVDHDADAAPADRLAEIITEQGYDVDTVVEVS